MTLSPGMVDYRCSLLACAGRVQHIAGLVALGLAGTALLHPTQAFARPDREVRSYAVSAPTDWLGEINRYRVASGLAPAVEQPEWTQGIKDHLVYLEKTPRSYMTGQYESSHTENPASPYYTPGGDQAARSSNLGGGPTPVAAIDGWLIAPFHAIGILRPGLTRTAFASGEGGAGLDVIRGIDNSVPRPAAPILFPGPGMTTDLTSFTGENPSPLETCGWEGTTGLPLLAMLPVAPAVGLTADVVAADGTRSSSSDRTLCIVDEHTFITSDSVYGPTGLSILRSERAVLLIPRKPLGPGAVTAIIRQPNAPDVSWSFTVDAPPTKPASNGSGAGTASGEPTRPLPTGEPTRPLQLQSIRGRARGPRMLSVTASGAAIGRTAEISWSVSYCCRFEHVARTRVKLKARNLFKAPRSPTAYRAGAQFRARITVAAFDARNGRYKKFNQLFYLPPKSSR